MSENSQRIAARIAEIIRTRPAAWDQEVWLKLDAGHGGDVASMRADLDAGDGSCGTTACVAGWAAILNAPENAKAAPPQYWLIRRLVMPDGTAAEIKRLGQAALEIDGRVMSWLFADYRTRDQVLTALDSLAAGRRPELSGDDGDDEFDDDGEIFEDA